MDPCWALGLRDWTRAGLGAAASCLALLGCGLTVPLQLDMAEAGSGHGVGGESSQGGNDAGIDATFGNGGGDTAPFSYSALCGGGCVPDMDAGACETTSEGGAGGSAPSGVPGACQLAYDEASQAVDGLCGEVGAGLDGSLCMATSDCGAGLACVQGGACRAYCCRDIEACAQGTFCHPEHLAAGIAGAGEGVVIPVCVPVRQCTLLDDALCPAGTTCTIVRVDGTTSCVEPGSGRAGELCPCAAGYVCATATGLCVKLCRIGHPGDCPGSETCQGGSTTYPAGFGVCIGG